MGMKGASLKQELAQLGVHLIQVVDLPFPYFGGRVRLKCPFFYALFLIIFQGSRLYRLLHDLGLSYPIVVLEGQGCGDLANLPIATVNVLATNDQGRNWCMDDSHGTRESGVWHDHCARVRVCQMSGWLRRQTNVLPTLYQVNA